MAARIPAGPNGNHFGATYAGCLFSVAEVLGGIFASTSLVLEGAVPLVKQVTIDFLRPATTAVTARASLTEETIARVLTETAERGKADFLLETEVSDEQGTVVARTSGTYQPASSLTPSPRWGLGTSSRLLRSLVPVPIGLPGTAGR
ncbi:DUF4442 domain-containing protein [Nocardioides sp. W3-2-3]|nr:DUF4442 domain-containing protein [Nocardioides convexus]